jgi:hypothetical protein
MCDTEWRDKWLNIKRPVRHGRAGPEAGTRRALAGLVAHAQATGCTGARVVGVVHGVESGRLS